MENLKTKQMNKKMKNLHIGTTQQLLQYFVVFSSSYIHFRKVKKYHLHNLATLGFHLISHLKLFHVNK